MVGTGGGGAPVAPRVTGATRSEGTVARTSVFTHLPGVEPGSPRGRLPPPSTSPTQSDAVHEKLETTIQAIRPAIQADGGDIFLRGFDDETGVVEVELTGACVSCPASTVTLKAGVERILKDRVPGVTAVEAVGLDSETAVSL